MLEQGGKDNFLKLIYEQTISKAEEIYGSLLYDIKNEVEREILLGIGSRRLEYAALRVLRAVFVVSADCNFCLKLL